jgi:hypothetical protein
MKNQEPYVDVNVAAAYLAVSPRRLLDLTRAGRVLGHPLGLGTMRQVWRYRLSELEECLSHDRTSSAVVSDSRSKSKHRSSDGGAGR